MTLSVIARCARTGQFGVAAMTAVPAVGKLLAHAAPRVGAIATQARTNPYLGLDGIALLQQGRSAEVVLAKLKQADPRIEARQVAVIDAAGRTASFTGSECTPYAGVLAGDAFSIQGNRLGSHRVLEAAASAFTLHADKPLAERMLEALCASDAAGGDRHEEESASIYVMDVEEYPLWDVRVDHHPEPLVELRRLYGLFRERLLPEILRMPTRENPAGKEEESEA